MNELSERAREQLRRARRGLEPTRADRERIAQRLALTLAAPPVPSSEGASGKPLVGGDVASPADQQVAPEAATTGATSGASLAKASAPWVLTLVLGTMGSIAGYRAGFSEGRAAARDEANAALAGSKTPDAPGSSVTAPTPSTMAASLQGTQPGPVSIESRPRRIENPELPKSALPEVRRESEADSRGAIDPNAEEVFQLKRVQRGLRDSNPELALVLLDELDQRIPRGRLLEERAAARIMAGCSLGRPQPGARRAFERNHPRSLYLSRIAERCDGGNAAGGSSAGASEIKAGATESEASGQD